MMGKIFLALRGILLVCVTTIVCFANTDEEYVIIEKPSEEIKYEMVNTDGHAGSPVVKSRGTYWGFGKLNKEFTNVAANTENVASSFVGLSYGYTYNWNHFSLVADSGIYYGKKSVKLANEDSNTGLQESLSNQILLELGGNLVFNSLEAYYFRPYFGGGAYYNRYKYIVSDGSTETKNYGISSSFVRAGLLLDISKLDTDAKRSLWKDFGVYRASLQVEMKKYTPSDSTGTSKAELNTSLIFEY